MVEGRSSAAGRHANRQTHTGTDRNVRMQVASGRRTCKCRSACKQAGSKLCAVGKWVESQSGNNSNMRPHACMNGWMDGQVDRQIHLQTYMQGCTDNFQACRYACMYCMHACTSLRLHVCLYVCLAGCLASCLTVCLDVWLSGCLPACLSPSILCMYVRFCACMRNKQRLKPSYVCLCEQ